MTDQLVKEETEEEIKVREAKETKEAKAKVKADKKAAKLKLEADEKEKLKKEIRAEMKAEADLKEKLRLELEAEELLKNKEENKTLEEELGSAVKTAKQLGVTKNKVRVFDDEDMVPVISIATGGTDAKNPNKPFDNTHFEKLGDVQSIRFGTLSWLRANKKDCFKSMLYILDEEVIKELGLQKTYDGFGKIEDIIKILDAPLKTVINFVDNASKEVKNIVGQILIDKIQRKESIDYFKVKAVSEKLELDIDMERVSKDQ
jgi:hypothetical protein